MWNGRYCCKHFGKYNQPQSFQLWAGGGRSVRASSVHLRRATSKSRELSSLYHPIKSNIALYIVYKVQYGLLDFPKGLVLTKENNNTENLLFWTSGSSFRTRRPGPYRAGPSVPRPILSLGMLPGCKGQPFLPWWQCPSSCLLHPRSRTQFSEAQIKSMVSLKSALSTLGPFNNGNMHPSNV